MNVGASEQTPLDQAATSGNVAVMRQLMIRGAQGATAALESACHWGNAGSARLLIETGTPVTGDLVFTAAEAGATDVLAVLAEFGADLAVRWPNDGSSTAGLTLAQMARRVEQEETAVWLESRLSEEG